MSTAAPDSPVPASPGGKTARLTGLLVLLLGGLALAAPWIQGKGSSYLLGLVLLITAALRFRQTYPAGQRRVWLARAIHNWAAVVAGVLLFAAPGLVFTGLALLLGLSWVIEGVAELAGAWR